MTPRWPAPSWRGRHPKGTALDAVAYITRGSVSATPILFYGANKLGWSDYDELYGWKFEDEYGSAAD